MMGPNDLIEWAEEYTSECLVTIIRDAVEYGLEIEDEGSGRWQDGAWASLEDTINMLTQAQVFCE